MFCIYHGINSILLDWAQIVIDLQIMSNLHCSAVELHQHESDVSIVLIRYKPPQCQHPVFA